MHRPTEAQQQIRRIIGQLYETAFLSDFENVPRWNYAILETHKISQGPVGIGTIYQQLRSVPSRNQERFEVTAYTPPGQLEIQGQLGPFPSRLSYALDTVPEGTRITNSVELELRGPGRLLGRPRASSSTTRPPPPARPMGWWSE